jgi:hypothetical protein
MKPSRFTKSILACVLAVVVLSSACDDDKSTKPPSEPVVTPPTVMPDFTLADRNPNSPTFEANISPRNYLEKVSCYYFTAAT